MFDMIMSNGGRNRFPFTASQWQELEHQALIFKYMVSGIPVPPDLLYTIKRSFLDSSLSSKLFSSPAPQHVGWNCFQIGLGRKVDPEPGRCRRTDGKKWRCSKEAYPDSKYCERHMHRGKSRSRKPVEFSATPSAAAAATTCSPIVSSPSSSSKDHLFSLSNSPNEPTQFQHRPAGYNTYHDPNLHAHRNGYRDSNGDVYGLKEDVDEHAFFSEPRGTVRSFSGSSVDDPWQLSPLTINSSATKQRTCSALQNEYSYLQLQSLAESRSPREEKQDQIFSLRRDIKCEMPPMELDKGEIQRTVHHFFDELPPPKDKDSWLDLDDRSSNTASLSTTRLSISMPSSSHDNFPIFNSRSPNDA